MDRRCANASYMGMCAAREGGTCECDGARRATDDAWRRATTPQSRASVVSARARATSRFLHACFFPRTIGIVLSKKGEKGNDPPFETNLSPCLRYLLPFALAPPPESPHSSDHLPFESTLSNQPTRLDTSSLINLSNRGTSASVESN